jgi:hypothetical protein
VYPGEQAERLIWVGDTVEAINGAIVHGRFFPRRSTLFSCNVNKTTTLHPPHTLVM